MAGSAPIMPSFQLSKEGLVQVVGRGAMPCDSTLPEPPEAALEPSQHDPATNSPVAPDFIPLEYLLEGLSTAPFYQPSEHDR